MATKCFIPKSMSTNHTNKKRATRIAGRPLLNNKPYMLFYNLKQFNLKDKSRERLDLSHITIAISKFLRDV